MPKRQPTKESLAFGRRLVELLESNGQDRRGMGAYLAKRYGKSNVQANAWLNGDNKPRSDIVRKIAEDHGVSFDALYVGAKTANPSRYEIREASEEHALPIELSSARGSCGGGALAWDDERRAPLLKEPSWFKRFKIKPRDALAVWADGDSMADFIIDGDIVIFDKSKNEPKSGRIFLIEHPDGLRIKRLRRDIGGDWILESSNTDKRIYPDERVQQDQAELLKILGEFVYRQGG